MSRLLYSLALSPMLLSSALAAPAQPAKKAPPAAKPAAAKKLPDDVLSDGKETILVDHLRPEAPSIVLFYRPNEEDDRDLEAALRKRATGDPRVGYFEVKLNDLSAPIAKQYEIESTPVAFVYDRNKILLGKAKDLGQIGGLVVKGLHIARIKWVNEDDPKAPEAYRTFGGGQRPVPEIMKTMSLRPELMEALNDLSQKAHFSDGFLPRKTKEMIASYVSALNKCKY